ncbi:MAG TPA: hypothetical protein VFT13_08520, partial [Candidatus Krumholzibacteria bacterium]|nr:hypothetical protein [Candidatus Krumholzibacteria bacterium]
MAADFNVRTENERSNPSDPSNFADLDSRTQQGAYRGLAAAATIYAAVFFLGYVSDWFIHVAADGHFHFLPLFDTVTSLIAIGYSGFVAYRCHKTDCTACFFQRMATVFLVVSSLGIAVQAWGWEGTSRFEIETVSWV